MTLPTGLNGFNLTLQAMESAAEMRIRELCSLANSLLQDIDGDSPQTDAMLRFDAVRIFHLCHTITDALVHNDPARAYAISQGDEIGGDSLGVAV